MINTTPFTKYKNAVAWLTLAVSLGLNIYLEATRTRIEVTVFESLIQTLTVFVFPVIIVCTWGGWAFLVPLTVSFILHVRLRTQIAMWLFGVIVMSFSVHYLQASLHGNKLPALDLVMFYYMLFGSMFTPFALIGVFIFIKRLLVNKQV